MSTQRSNFEDVYGLHMKHQLPRGGEPALLDQEAFRFRYEFLKEELSEFQSAQQEGDLAAAADALIDLVVVAMGTAVMMGLPWQLLWDEVNRANGEKQRGNNERGVEYDLVKPEGWVPPRIKLLLEIYALCPYELNPTFEELTRKINDHCVVRAK